MTSINIAKLGSGSELNPTVMVGETRQENNSVIIEVSQVPVGLSLEPIYIL